MERISVTGKTLRHLAIFGVLASAMTGIGGAHAEPKAVIELFTSQGCSSCPPADRLLGELGFNPSVITMSLPVDYWDYIGWKDTLALPGHTKRQWAYAQTLGDRGVYTPQAIVNGSIPVIGSDRAAIERAIEQSRETSNEPTLPVSISVADDQIKIVTPAAKVAGMGEVWLCTISKAVPVAIGRGENRGRTITYHNVVRDWHKLGDWTGAPHAWTVAVKDLHGTDVDEVAVFVQTGSAQSPGTMLGAAVATLH